MLTLKVGRSTGRKCDGYSNVGHLSHSEIIETSLLNSEKEKNACIPSKIKCMSKQSPLETRSLEYFHYNTLPALFGLIKTDVWTRLVPQLSEAEPTIRTAMCALSSFHELCEKDSFDKMFAKKTGEDGAALQLYNKAIGQVRARISTGPTSKTVALVSCLLFTCLEFVRGDRDTALTHLKSGMNILKLQSRDADSPLDENTSDEIVAPVFSRLSLLSTIYGQPRDKRYIDLLTINEPPMPPRFTSLEQARNSMINITNAVMSVAYYMDLSLFSSQVEADAARLSVVESIEYWLNAFQPFLDRKDTDYKAATLLKSTIILDRIWVSRFAGRKDECAFDDYIDDFREVVEGMETVIEGMQDTRANNKPVPSFTIDTGMISTLYFTANKCRDRLLRRRAIELMKQCPRREGLFDSLELCRVSEFVVEVEEKGLPPLPYRTMPLEECRVGDYVIENRSAVTNTQVVRLYHGLAWSMESLLATRTFDYDELDSGGSILEIGDT